MRGASDHGSEGIVISDAPGGPECTSRTAEPALPNRQGVGGPARAPFGVWCRN